MFTFQLDEFLDKKWTFGMVTPSSSALITYKRETSKHFCLRYCCKKT